METNFHVVKIKMKVYRRMALWNNGDSFWSPGQDVWTFTTLFSKYDHKSDLISH